MKIGLVGYGTGGQHFHAPFICAARGVELAGIVARAPTTVAKVKRDFPDIPVYDDLKSLLEAGVDAVTITTPPHTRRELVLEAIAAGVAVIADKPFAPDAETGRELAAAAEKKGVLLSVYHNRRFDADILTVKKLLEQQRLGRLWRVHSRMDYNDPDTLEAGEQGGLLRDIGSHLVDQAVWLLGPVKAVFAQTDKIARPEGPTVASFVITLIHESGVHSHLSSTKTCYLNAREWRLYGEEGSFVSLGTDVQAQAIFAGKRPADNLSEWGYEQPDRWGVLRTAEGETRVESEQGRYHAYYEAFAEAFRTGSPPPVTTEQAIRTLEVLDAAMLSAERGELVTLS